MEEILKKIKTKQYFTYELLRFYLGFALFVKGIYFILHIGEVSSLVNSQFGFLDFFISHFVVIAHIVGGIFIAIGLYTRIACAVNLPVLLSAIFLSQASTGGFSGRADFELASMVTVLLVFFVINGSGMLSLDDYIIKYSENNQH